MAIAVNCLVIEPIRNRVCGLLVRNFSRWHRPFRSLRVQRIADTVQVGAQHHRAWPLSRFADSTGDGTAEATAGLESAEVGVLGDGVPAQPATTMKAAMQRADRFHGSTSIDGGRGDHHASFIGRGVEGVHGAAIRGLHDNRHRVR